VAGPVLLQLKGVRLTRGAAPLFEGVDLALAKGERAALVGANGAGKSTLLAVLAGSLEADSGAIARSSGATLSLVPQEPDFGNAATLRAYASAAAPAYAAEAELSGFGLDPDRAPAGLSGGEARRAALPRAFAADPDILLLDEPTNHLDVAAIEDLEERLLAFKGAVLVISHDRRFLERVSTLCFWLRRGRVQRLDKSFTAFDDWAEAIETEEARALAKLETQLKAEEHWLLRGVTARRSRNEGRRRKLMAMRAERREMKGAMAARGAEIDAARGAESGRLVLEAKGVSKSYGGRAIVSGLDLRVLRGDRIGIVGPNGAGKTTLLDLLLGRRTPDVGSIRHGVGLEIAYIDQARALLDEGATVQQSLTPLGGDSVLVRGRSMHVAAYAKQFLFGPEMLRQPVSALSGGEKNRLALAITLARTANLLVLDEPTNDLDMDTLDALEEAVALYDGTVLIVSHDRAFLDAVTTSVVGAVGEGRWAETPGGYADFVREHGRPRASALAAPPPQPKAPPPPPPSRKPAKLSYKDERRLGEIEAGLPRLEAEIAALEARLADAALFAADPKAYQAATSRLEAARAEKDAMETDWLEIESRRDALGD
jgi:ATP-binding cassette subfamily F protein uup